MSFLWKTHCIIIAYILRRVHIIFTMNTVNRRTRYNGNAETSFSVDLPAPDCLVLLLQVYRNWSDFLSVKSNSLVSLCMYENNSAKLVNEAFVARRGPKHYSMFQLYKRIVQLQNSYIFYEQITLVHCLLSNIT
jgi:hypothetical protein